MKRMTLSLPDDLDARLRRAAASRGQTVASVIREAIEGHLAIPRRLIAAKAGRSGHRDTARRIKEIIRQNAGRSG
jgi:predicted transcriptional regulator